VEEELKRSAETVQMQREISQLKTLNQKLVAQNVDLQDKVDVWTQKQKFEIMVGKINSANIQKLETLVHKTTANYWIKRINKHVSELTKKHSEEIKSIKQSFAEEIDSLQEIVASLSENLIFTIKKKIERWDEQVSKANNFEKIAAQANREKEEAKLNLKKYQMDFTRMQDAVMKVLCVLF
jgi:uncharacterized protein YicC (UPF0701 family)